MVAPTQSTNLSSLEQTASQHSTHTVKLSPTISSVRYHIVDAPTMHVDSSAAENHRQQYLSLVDAEVVEKKQKCRSEFDAKESAINMKFEHDLATMVSTVELSRQNALFQLESQHRVRMYEIQQMALEHKLGIEASAAKLLLEASQQKLNKYMDEKMVKIDDSYVSTRNALFMGSVSDGWTSMNWNNRSPEIPVHASRSFHNEKIPASCPNCGTSMSLE